MLNKLISIFFLIISVTSVHAGTKWIPVVKGGDAETNESGYFFSLENRGEVKPARIVQNPSGEGHVFEVDINSSPENSFDSEFFIRADRGLLVGQKFRISFRYMTTDSRTIDTQAHKEPNVYQHWLGIGTLQSESTWEEVSLTQTILNAQDGMQSIAFLLSSVDNEAKFYIDNIVMEVEVDENDDYMPGTSYVFHSDFNGDNPGFFPGCIVSNGVLSFSGGGGDIAAGYQFWNDLPFKENKKYILSLKIRGSIEDNGTAHAYLQCISGWKLRGDFGTIPISTEWTTVKLSTICSGDDADLFFISLFSNGKYYNGTIEIDELSIFVVNDDSTSSSNIESIESTSYPEQFFNLNGLPIDITKSSHGIYILRQGSITRKILNR